MSRTPPRRVSVVVATLLFVITAALVVLTWNVTQRSEERLLDRQLAQVGTLLTNQSAVLQVQLADIGLVAVRTDGDPGIFAGFAAEELEDTGQSLSLWRVDDESAEHVAEQGVAPWLLDDGPARIADLEPTGELVIFGILTGGDGADRLAYGLMPDGDNTDLVVYAESPLPQDRRMRVGEDSPVAGLDLALYLGRTTEARHLLQATAETPIRGDAQTTAVPFGDSEITIVGASPTPLAGELAAALPWIVLGVGIALAVGGATTVEYVSRRRAEAERLAAENERLYRQQRGIASTLQHALLPAVPDLGGVEVAARYVAGVDELDVGGDWYDVIEQPSGRLVFVVGDVSGRGLAAATTMAALRFAVRAYLAEGHDIDAVLGRLRGLLDVSVDHQFATVLLGEIDTCTGRVRVVSAGHFPPLLITDDGAFPVECPVTPPVGVDAPAGTAPVTEVSTSGPATLLAFTDGLVESRAEALDHGLDRLSSVVAGPTGDRPLPDLVDHVLHTLTVGAAQDDTVLLGIRWGGRTGPGPAAGRSRSGSDAARMSDTPTGNTSPRRRVSIG